MVATTDNNKQTDYRQLLSHSPWRKIRQGQKSHHTKFYQNRLKNMEVMTIVLPPQIRGKFVQKYEILKFGRIQFFTPEEVGFPRGCSFLRL